MLMQWRYSWREGSCGGDEVKAPRDSLQSGEWVILVTSVCVYALQ